MKREQGKMFWRICQACGVLSVLLGLTGCSGIPDGLSLLIPKATEFVPALIAFAVIWAVLSKLAWPTIIQTLEDRQSKIQEGLKEAEQAHEEAFELQKRHEEQILDAQREATEIIAEAQRQATEERARIVANAQKDASALIARAHDAIDSERHRATIELSNSVVDLAVEIASKIIGNNLSLEDQRRLAEHYLAEIGDEHGDEAN